jgi:hypothetical protein
VGALRAAAANPPDLVIVDLGLPDIDGVEVIAGLRGWSTVPVIVLSARDSQAQKVRALDAGADDYVTKPFGMDELVARVRAALRRADVHELAVGPVVTTPSFTLDLAAKRATKDGADVRLTPTEWHLVGTGVREGDELPARLLRTVAPQARGLPQQPAPLHHRARRRLPLRALNEKGTVPFPFSCPQLPLDPRRVHARLWATELWGLSPRFSRTDGTIPFRGRGRETGRDLRPGRFVSQSATASCSCWRSGRRSCRRPRSS